MCVFVNLVLKISIFAEGLNIMQNFIDDFA